MNRRTSLKMLICLSLVSVLVLSAPLVGSAGENKKPIKVGVATTITGPLADDGRHHVRALEMARDKINAGGGLLGRPVELVIADLGNYTPTELAAVRDTLKAADVDVVNYNWTVYPAVTDYLMQVGVPVMHHGWVTVDWKEWYDHRDKFPYWMTLNRTEEGYGVPYFQALTNPEMVTWKFPNKKAAIMVSDLDYSVIQAKWWREEAERQGWDIVLHEVHPVGNVDFGSQFAKIRQEKPAIVFMCSVISTEVIAAFTDFLEDPTNSLFVITWVINKPEFKAAFGEKANGVLGTVPGFFFVDSEYTGQNPTYKTYYENGKAIWDESLKRYGERPSIQTPIAYDSFWAWAEAVKRVGDVRDFDRIMEAMFDHPYVGATGTYGFDRETHAGSYDVDKLPIGYYQMQGGKVITLAVGVGRDVEKVTDFQVPWWIK
ncbi:MAG: ABC transporter substrate-binding protein [bacterium]